MWSSSRFRGEGTPVSGRWCFGTAAGTVVPYQVQRVLDGVSSAWPVALGKRSRNDPQHVFLLGRQYEQRVDASALRADEGRGIAAISVGEPRAGIDPTISEWGNPIVVKR